MLRTLDLFAGIGGFAHGLEMTGGFEAAAFCEIEPYAQAVLRKRWPHVRIYDDVKQLSAERLAADGISIDVITGGFPCQDISEAKQGAAGLSGDQSSLGFEMLRLIEEIRPKVAIFENSRRLRALGLDVILGRLAAIRYDAEWHVLSAAAIGAPHKRERLYVVAYPHGEPALWPAVAWPERPAWPCEPNLPRVAHGVPNQPHRRRVLGNAVVPQIPRLLGEAILIREFLS